MTSTLSVRVLLYFGKSSILRKRGFSVASKYALELRFRGGKYLYPGNAGLSYLQAVHYFWGWPTSDE